MKVGKLKQLLSKYKDTDIVVIAMTDEDFSPIDTVESGRFIPLNEELGDFVNDEDLEEDNKINLDDSVKAVALYPMVE